MIATDALFTGFVRLVAPWVWRRNRKIAEKLMDFAATEAGSALDMFAAAELTKDPQLRRQYFRHALDEDRHAKMFARAARALVPAADGRRYSFVHATRQNLFARMSEIEFLAFVHLAEKRGEAHFAALADHFSDREELGALLARIAKDERFHVSYSRRALERHSPRAVRRALWTTRLRAAWQAWRRRGRLLGDLMVRAVLTFTFVTTVPFFALALRLLESERPGWKTPRRAVDPRRMF